MVQDIYALVQKNKKLARLCEELLENTSILIEDDHGDKELSHYLSLLETQNLSNFSIIFSFAGKLLKTIGLFEKCCQNEYLLGTIYEISTLAVYVHLAHYMACAKEYKNGLCYTKFVDPKKHPSTYINIKGLWNVGIAPNKAISNDVYMDGAQANLYFILGSNAGGKTTLAKILPVLPQTYGISPARKATQSIFHKVLTYFNIEDGNLVKGTSQYTSELDRIEYGLGVLDQEARDKNILWIVDEGAKGTGEDFAKVLLGELAKYVIEEYQNSGFIFITHYKDVRTMAKEFPRIENYTAIVDHVNEDQFVYTYKIKKGTPPLGEDLIIAVKILNKRPGFPPKLRERINSVIREKT